MQVAVRILANTPLWVFSLQCGVAVATAMKLEPHAAVAVIGHAVSGAAALWRRYRNFDDENAHTRIPN
jgi:hypothetical protein